MEYKYTAARETNNIYKECIKNITKTIRASNAEVIWFGFS